MKLHLHQFLRQSGIFPYKEFAAKAVENGKIKLDGVIILNPDYRFNPKKHTVTYLKKTVVLPSKKYYIVNKPKGYISGRLNTIQKKEGKRSVFDLINCSQTIKNSLVVAGRLDEDTTGLMIITNDGKLVHRIINKGMEKVYVAELEKNISDTELNTLASGVMIKTDKPYKTKKCKVKRLSKKSIKIILKEGKKRQIRLMIETVGNKVLELKRIKIKDLELSGPIGQVQETSKDQIRLKLGLVVQSKKSVLKS